MSVALAADPSRLRGCLAPGDLARRAPAFPQWPLAGLLLSARACGAGGDQPPPPGAAPPPRGAVTAPAFSYRIDSSLEQARSSLGE